LLKAKALGFVNLYSSDIGHIFEDKRKHNEFRGKLLSVLLLQ